MKRNKDRDEDRDRDMISPSHARPCAALYILVFFSGFTGLVYQLLWMRQLGLLFGNTAHAAATTLALFFAGLAAGSWFWGRRVTRRHKPLRVYAWLEVGIAVTALVYFGIMVAFRLVYPALYQRIGPGTVLFLVKCLLAMALVFPPAFFMGGTIPAMGQHLIASRERFGATTARIYGINTLGAALGALLAAFVLIPLLGFSSTCLGVIVITGGIATVAFRHARRDGADDVGKARAQTVPSDRRYDRANAPTPADGVGRRTIFLLACLSGVSVLALEVLWTRMFAQVHENSVYSFATVLVLVLLCLSLGALLAALLAGTRLGAGHCLSALLIAGGGVLAFSPALFMALTDDLTMLSTAGTFAGYVGSLFVLAFVSMGPACLLLGTVFPYLMKSEQPFATSPGRSIGYLSAVNTVGAILGALLCGFVLLRTLGMWRTMQGIAAIYLLVGMLLPTGFRARALQLRAIGVVCLVLLFTALDPSDLPTLGTNPDRGPRTVVETWEASDCTVAVIRGAQGQLAIKLNSNYVLGATDAIAEQVYQARVPLFAYPATERIFFLGMGTGITAGGALDRDLFDSVERVVACELVPEVVTAARRYMAGGAGGVDYTNGLFRDSRVEILVADGRHVLMASDDVYDMINADLFLPYRSGAGSLYSREHFRNARARLARGGVFVQWLPLFQLTDFEFGTITRTMLSVFDQVTLWRNTFTPGHEIVALVGHKGPAALPPCELDMRGAKHAAVRGKGWRDLPELQFSCSAQTVALFYCGNVSAARDRFAAYPINTDDKPLIEYRSPRSMHKKTADGLPLTVVGPRLAELVDSLLETCPPDRDPVLANRTAENRRLPLAGAALHRAWVAYAMRKPAECREAWNTFITGWTNGGR